MGILSYGGAISFDGYVADASGDFQWAAPTPEVFDVHLERMAEVSTEVLGRNTYELMQYWDADPDGPQPGGEVWSGAEREFARRWQQLDKVVASSSLAADDLTAGDRLIPDLGLDELRGIVESAAGVVEIFGPTVAAEAIRAGLVQDFRFFVVPTVVGGGRRALPDDAHVDLRLVEHRIFDDGTAFLRYVPR